MIRARAGILTARENWCLHKSRMAQIIQLSVSRETDHLLAIIMRSNKWKSGKCCQFLQLKESPQPVGTLICWQVSWVMPALALPLMTLLDRRAPFSPSWSKGRSMLHCWGLDSVALELQITQREGRYLPLAILRSGPIPGSTWIQPVS